MAPKLTRSTSEADDRLRQLAERLQQGVVRIVAFGMINSGKSSLLNALLEDSRFETGAWGGVTQNVAEAEVGKTYTIKGYGQSRVVVVDTPGIGEVSGDGRGKLAFSEAAEADLVLFVTAGDITDIEFNALESLAATGKPLLLVLNKADIYSPEQLREVKSAVRRRLKGLVAENRIVEIASAPSRRVLREHQDGRVVYADEVAPPDIRRLTECMTALLAAEGKALIALNALRSLSAAEEAVGVKRKAAVEIIDGYSWKTALAVALNPVPVLDIRLGKEIHFAMIAAIAAVYGYNLDVSELPSTYRRIKDAVPANGWGLYLCSAAKLFVGWGNVLAFVPQAGLAGYQTDVIGRAAIEYFVAGMKLGTKEMREKATSILQSTDRKAYVAEIGRRLNLARE
jgi:small GTP-binding protein